MNRLGNHHPVHFHFRRKGLPKRLKRIPGGVPGLAGACNIHVAGMDFPAAKVAVFRDRKSLRNFYDNILPRYRGMESLKTDKLGRRCAGMVNKLGVEFTDGDGELVSIEVDRNYFCFVGLVEGFLTAEILAHEACHVGFAWDYRTRGGGLHAQKNYPEENICYPAGIFLDQCLSFIKAEGLREI